MESLEVKVERIIYQNPLNGYVVALVSEGYEKIRIAGIMSDIHIGEALTVQGDFANHPKYGRQFTVTACETNLPTTGNGIINFLASGIVSGVGPAIAQRIFYAFEERTFDILDNDIGRLIEIQGISEKKLRKISEQWGLYRNSRKFVSFMIGHGISTTLAIKIYKEYEDKAMEVVLDNPYRIALDVSGVGFMTADKLASRLGFSTTSPQRVLSCAVYVLQLQAQSGGHVFLPIGSLAEEIFILTALDTDYVIKTLRQLCIDNQGSKKETIIFDGDNVYSASLYFAEIGVAKNLLAFNGTIKVSQEDIDKYCRGLSDEQKSAVMVALSNPVSILTGGAGTGKTKTTQSLVDILDKMRVDFHLVSPTGRAAKRLAEVTGHEAKTIHRLLGYNGREDSWKRDFESSFVIIDEVSMVDLPLMHKLVRALPRDCGILVVGDDHQLSSVGVGCVLTDMIKSNLFPVTSLTRVFRQGDGSNIVVNANAVNSGTLPDLKSVEGFNYIEANESNALQIVGQIVNNDYLEKFGYETDSVQVLAPMYKPICGVEEVNKFLQSELRPFREHKNSEWRRGRDVIRVGDRVIQTKNNYKLGVYNGDVGVVSEIDFESSSLLVTIDNVDVEYDFLVAQEELSLAYCITIHKSQGSEYPVVVVVILNNQGRMLARNLLYTAMTRARELCILVGESSAIQRAVSNNITMRRNSNLINRLIGAKNGTGI